jgi:hypothetical protein
MFSCLQGLSGFEEVLSMPWSESLFLLADIKATRQIQPSVSKYQSFWARLFSAVARTGRTLARSPKNSAGTNYEPGNGLLSIQNFYYYYYYY